jgi:hypothetical protein
LGQLPFEAIHYAKLRRSAAGIGLETAVVTIGKLEYDKASASLTPKVNTVRTYAKRREGAGKTKLEE